MSGIKPTPININANILFFNVLRFITSSPFIKGVVKCAKKIRGVVAIAIPSSPIIQFHPNQEVVISVSYM